jgi:hypothetical protein
MNHYPLFNGQNPQFSIDFILSKARGSLLANGMNPVAFNSAVTAQLNLAAAAQRQINQRNAAMHITQKVNLFRNYVQPEKLHGKLVFHMHIFKRVVGVE